MSASADINIQVSDFLLSSQSLQDFAFYSISTFTLCFLSLNIQNPCSHRIPENNTHTIDRVLNCYKVVFFLKFHTSFNICRDQNYVIPRHLLQTQTTNPDLSLDIFSLFFYSDNPVIPRSSAYHT